MITTTIDYQKLQDWRPKRLHCHFRLSVVFAITCRHLIRARHGRKSRTCCWNFDAICCSFSGITISGLAVTSLFPPHITGSRYNDVLTCVGKPKFQLQLHKNKATSFHCLLSDFRQKLQWGHFTPPPPPLPGQRLA